jgi:uncharacterized protein YjiS (DUF1127 family)
MSATFGSQRSGTVSQRYGLRAATAVFLRLARIAGGFIRGRLARLKAHRETARTISVLQALDARTLRDIGADRSEAGSIAAELCGAAERTRRRILDGEPWS